MKNGIYPINLLKFHKQPFFEHIVYVVALCLFDFACGYKSMTNVNVFEKASASILYCIVLL